MNIQELTELLKNRASHRKYLQTPVTEEQIRALVDCARLAPSGHNHQPWRFLALSNKTLLNDMAAIVVKSLKSLFPSLPETEIQMLEKYKFFMEHFKDAPLVIVVLGKKDSYTTTELLCKYNLTLPKPELYDMELLGIGAAIQNLLLAAQAQGLGTCWLSEPVVYAQKELEVLLNVAAPYHIVSLISVGVPAKEKKGAPRLSVDELLEIRTTSK
ncbi:MAG: nitroreductase family protein [Candidatus Riflebacteria bacterium]|nr:nitroreductase family protein [Candidatus Riflebacteria bacterium]